MKPVFLHVVFLAFFILGAAPLPASVIPDAKTTATPEKTSLRSRQKIKKPGIFGTIKLWRQFEKMAGRHPKDESGSTASTASILGFVFSIASIALLVMAFGILASEVFLLLFSLLAGIAGLVLSIYVLASESNKASKVLGILGLVFSGLYFLFVLFFIALLFIFLNNF
jgi:hypothetical protein